MPDAATAAAFVLVADGELLLLDRDTPGVTVEKLVTVEDTRRVGELVFDDVRVEPSMRLSADAVAIARILDAGRIALAADALAAAERSLERAVAYALERKQFERVIGSFQAVKHMCAEMAAALEPCRALVWYAGHALDALPGEAPLTACHAKAHLSEVGKQVAKTATEVHGGMGFTDLVGPCTTVDHQRVHVGASAVL